MANTILDTNIMDLLGLGDLPSERKQQLLDKMTAVIQGRVADRVFSSLDEAHQKDLDALIARAATAEEMDAFLHQAVPNYDQIMQEEITKYKTDMTADAQAIRDMMTSKAA